MTQDAAQPRQAGSAVAGWSLRRKMASALAIPLLLAATLGGLRVHGDLADSRQAASSARQVTIIAPAIDYLTTSEAAMVAAQSDSAASKGDLIDSIAALITEAETLVAARDNADLNDLQAAHVDALLDLSQAMRAPGAKDLGPATWIALVRQLESSVSQLVTSVNAAQKTPEPRLEQVSQTMSGRLSLALQQGFVATTLAQSGSQDLFSEIGVEAAAIDRLAGAVDGAEDQVAALRSQNTRHASQIRNDAATGLDGRGAYAPYDEITATLLGGVTASLGEAASDARRNALIGAVLTLVALGAAIAIAIVIARSLLGPIGRVREGALAVARHRLPDAVARIRAGQEPEPLTTIDVTTNEEIGQVARAVDDLHRQAIHLASGEAQLRQTVNAMFVTLSRRSNSLVNQQLAQIERLEHDEEDPKRLESLFRLDHLASRMRRTADSLLILADAPNRAAGQFSLTAGEALQAATSAVQDYRRVQILTHLGTRIGDEAAPDVVHLLTELVDNALTYSPPSEPVRIAAHLGSDGVTITITDAGLGVPVAELEQLNRDLAHGAEATPDTARRMGLFVVSRLAERHGIHARLVRNPGGGMTATVVLPPTILPEVPQTSAPAPATATYASASTASTASNGSGTSEELPGSSQDIDASAPLPAESRRESRSRARAEKAQTKAAERAAKKIAVSQASQAEDDKLAAPAAPAAPTHAAETSAPETRAAETHAAETSAAETTPPRPAPPRPALRSPPRTPVRPTARRSAACCRAASPAPTSHARAPTPSCRRRPRARADRCSPSARRSPLPRRPRPTRAHLRAPRCPRSPRSPRSCRSPRWPRASVPRPSRPGSPRRSRGRTTRCRTRCLPTPTTTRPPRLSPSPSSTSPSRTSPSSTSPSRSSRTHPASMSPLTPVTHRRPRPCGRVGSPTRGPTKGPTRAPTQVPAGGTRARSIVAGRSPGTSRRWWSRRRRPPDSRAVLPGSASSPEASPRPQPARRVTRRSSAAGSRPTRPACPEADRQSRVPVLHTTRKQAPHDVRIRRPRRQLRR